MSLDHNDQKDEKELSTENHKNYPLLLIFSSSFFPQKKKACDVLRHSLPNLFEKVRITHVLLAMYTVGQRSDGGDGVGRLLLSHRRHVNVLSGER
jgi:hypothetical protein